jgi:hypothetical protein
VTETYLTRVAIVVEMICALSVEMELIGIQN